MQKENVWVYACEAEGENLSKTNLKGNIAIVMGSEGKGISRLVSENCDYLVKIPMVGHVNSLNASVSCSILIYEIIKNRI